MTLSALDYLFEQWAPGSLILKTTNVCTFKCKYCFWFRNKTVLKLPDLLSEDIEDALIQRVKTYVIEKHLRKFKIIFHGGEPLLWPLYRYGAFIEKMNKLKAETGCRFCYSIQTNGSLIDDTWAELFKKYDFAVGVSIDGPRDVQNINRRTLEGEDSYERVIKGINCLKRHNIGFGILAVANVSVPPEKVVDFFVKDLNVKQFDILIPDFTCDDKDKPSISSYYTSLYDYWISEYAQSGIEIRLFTNIINILLGNASNTECLGYGPMVVPTVDTNGNIGPTDTLMITDHTNCETGLNVLRNDLSEISKNNKFRWIMQQALTLPEKCKQCDLCLACAGGYLPHRWSNKTKDFQNPSAYCDDLKKLIKHIDVFLMKDVIRHVKPRGASSLN